MDIPFEKQQQALRLEQANEFTSIKIGYSGSITDAMKFIEQVLKINKDIDCKVTREQDTSVFVFTGIGSDLAKIIRMFYGRVW